VLDTNIILSDAKSFTKFDEHEVVIPIAVIEEIDHFKKEMNELGRNARYFSNLIDELRVTGSLIQGVTVNPQGGTVRIGFVRPGDQLPPDLKLNTPDNNILAVASWLSKNTPSREVIFVSKDTNLRIKADCLGICAETYENGQVDLDDLYSGRMQVFGDPKTFDDQPILYSDFITKIDLPRNPFPNEFIEVSDGSDSVYFRYRPESNLEPEQLMPISNSIEAWGLKPRNPEQMMAMDILLDDTIKVVTLVGKSGCGKTLMSIACALAKVTDEFVYRKLLVSRPVMPMGKDIGFLPGSIDEKLAPYMQPIYDNLEYLMSGYSANGVVKTKRKRTKKEEKVDEEKEVGGLGNGHLELVAAGILQVEPLLYIRGRSIPKQILIVDESQNLSPHELRTIITRAGEGTKIILTGDPTQVDNPYLDASSNGLVFCVDRFKNEAIAGHITLTICERSELAEIATRVLF